MITGIGETPDRLTSAQAIAQAFRRDARSTNDRSVDNRPGFDRVDYSHPPTFIPVKKLLDRIPSRLRNRYSIMVLALIGWITLFDRSDIWTTWKNHRELGRMEEQAEWYDAEIARTKAHLNEIASDKDLLEKFARERYLMKRDNEDIFVLVAEQR